MQKIIALLLIAASTQVCASDPDTSEGICIQSGILGQKLAAAMRGGQTEAELLTLFKAEVPGKNAGERFSRRLAGNIIKYLFTVKPSAENVRNDIYLKCKIGDFK